MPIVVASGRNAGAGWGSIFPKCFSANTQRQMVEESSVLRDTSSVRDFREAHITPEGRVYSQTKHWVSEPGPVLEAFHESVELVGIVERFSNRRMFPTRGAYIYYSVGGSVGLHTDVSTCQFSVLVPVVNAGEIVAHPELDGRPSEELLALSVKFDGHPPSGVPVPYPKNGALIIEGSRVPHHRPPTDSPTIIAALCFDSVGI